MRKAQMHWGDEPEKNKDCSGAPIAYCHLFRWQLYPDYVSRNVAIKLCCNQLACHLYPEIMVRGRYAIRMCTHYDSRFDVADRHCCCNHEHGYPCRSCSQRRSPHRSACIPPFCAKLSTSPSAPASVTAMLPLPPLPQLSPFSVAATARR